MRADGTYVGRAAPEIDIFEATVHDGIGQVRHLVGFRVTMLSSQTGVIVVTMGSLQRESRALWAITDANSDPHLQAEYKWLNTSANMLIDNPELTVLNEYAGGTWPYPRNRTVLTRARHRCLPTNNERPFYHQPGLLRAADRMLFRLWI